MARISLEHIDKIYPNGYIAARDLSLEVHDGELLVLVGPSGSGKSTVLRLMAGLERVTDGIIRIGDRDVTELPPQQRDVALLRRKIRHVPIADTNHAVGDALQARHQSQHRRLTAAGRSDEDKQFPVAHFEAQAARGDETVGVDLVDVI